MLTCPWSIACGIWDVACNWSYSRADGYKMITVSGCVFCIDCWIGKCCKACYDVYDITYGCVCVVG